MRWLLELLRALLLRRRSTAMVRPWALSAPVLVLLLTVPLLRPARHPDPGLVSDDEQAILGTTQAIVEQRSLALDRTAYRFTRRAVEDTTAPRGARIYAHQPPMLAVLLAGPYRVMHYYGLTFRGDGPMVEFLLTVLAAALPAASAAGLIYRMGRLFELDRPLRALLGFSAVFATGLGSYATVINPHVPAATLVLAAAACLVHLAIAQSKPVTAVWLALGGISAGLAATIDPSALPYLPLLAAVTLALRGVWYRRVVRLLVFCLGAALPIGVHLSFVLPAFGDPMFGVGLALPAKPTLRPVAMMPATTAASMDLPDDEPRTLPRMIGQSVKTISATLAGRHGPLSHFPILLLGAAGVFMVMHRHWPLAAKVLAAATLAGAVFLVLAYAVHRPDPATTARWRGPMYASRWFVVFGPILLFWAGAWLRRPHSAVAYSLMGVVLLFSIAAGVIGTFNPWPRDGYTRYTAVQAVERAWYTNGR